jgi:hypothetical protein
MRAVPPLPAAAAAENASNPATAAAGNGWLAALPGRTSAPRSAVYGSGVRATAPNRTAEPGAGAATAGVPAAFFLRSADALGFTALAGGDDWHVSIVPDAAAPGIAAPQAAVSNLGNGTYMVTFLPRLAGTYTVSVNLGRVGAGGIIGPAGGQLSETAFLAAAAAAGAAGDAGRPSSLGSPYSILVKSGAPDVLAAQIIGPGTRWQRPAAEAAATSAVVPTDITSAAAAAAAAAAAHATAAAAAAATAAVGRTGAVSGYPLFLVGCHQGTLFEFLTIVALCIFLHSLAWPVALPPDTGIMLFPAVQGATPLTSCPTTPLPPASQHGLLPCRL